ncbi:Fe-S cluster assembly protein SufD [Cardinium endosymbiont of Nabis limbatus]|uniref:Fe-S cluster assembly protein SufD n=1 Tax=Cardinium endosymbiont of Nabis limbatus TaxID=3066217 RepID=UPI003AF39E59
MIAFTNWLAEAFGTLSATEPFYTERLCLFNRLREPAFIASQKEDYTNLSEILQLLTGRPYHADLPTPPAFPVEMNRYVQLPEAVTVTFVNGVWSPSGSFPQGMQLHRLADLPLLEQKELLATYRADMQSSNDLFIGLNSLLSQESYLLDITADRLVVLEHIVTDSVAHVVPQLIIKVGKGCQVTILENWRTGQTEPFVNHFTNITLEEAAQLAYHTLYTDAASSCQFNSLYCNQKDHSTFTHHTFALGIAMLRMHIKAQISGSHASAGLYGLSALSETEKAAQQIQVIHRAPHSLSKQYYKSILGGHSTGRFSGKIYLTPAAQQTNAYQTNNTLILSDAAHHYAKPQLEIYADDVKCSHGATAGQLDEEQIFYLQTRGIAAPLAKRLLLEAFGSEIIDSVACAPLQDYLHHKLVAKLIKL